MKNEVLILIGGRLMQAALTIASFRLLTTFLRPADLGGFYLIMSISTLFGMFMLGPVGMYINRRMFAWHDSRDLFSHFLGYNVFAIATTVLAFAAVWLSWRFFGIGAQLSGFELSLTVAAYVYVLNWNQNFVPALNLLGYRGLFVAFSVLTTALGLALSVAFVRYISYSPISWMAGVIMATGGVAIVAAYSLRSRLNEARPSFIGVARYLRPGSVRGIAAFAVPLSCAAFFMWAQNQSYRVIVEKVIGPEFLAYMAVGFSISTSVAGILESLVQQVYLPGFYRSISSGDKNSRRLALQELAAKTIPVYIVYLFFIVGASEYLVRFLVDEKYREVFVYARYGAVVEFFRMSTNILASAAHSEMRTGSLIRPYLVGGVLAAVTAYLGAVSGRPQVLVPVALLLSGAVTFFAMQRAIYPIIEFRLDTAALFPPVMFSLLFLVFAALPPGGTARSVALLTAAGGYFILLQYWISRKWLGRGLGTPGPGDGAAGGYSPGEQ